jgi:hypothetical protein
MITGMKRAPISIFQSQCHSIVKHMGTPSTLSILNWRFADWSVKRHSAQDRVIVRTWDAGVLRRYTDFRPAGRH